MAARMSCSGGEGLAARQHWSCGEEDNTVRKRLLRVYRNSLHGCGSGGCVEWRARGKRVFGVIFEGCCVC